MITIYMIRHFATLGNLAGCYIGRTDEPVCKESIDACLLQQSLHPAFYAPVDGVFSSPMIRCRTTAKIIYPDQMPVILENLRECDFGEFENQNYQELSENVEYQKWIDSNGTLAFPGGEDPKQFRERSLEGFLRAVSICMENNWKTVAMVVHGGTIMSVLEKYGPSENGFYDWQIKNGEGISFEFQEEGRIERICIIH